MAEVNIKLRDLTPLERRTIKRLVKKVAKTQEAFWDAMADLERAVGFDLDATVGYSENEELEDIYQQDENDEDWEDEDETDN